MKNFIKRKFLFSLFLFSLLIIPGCSFKKQPTAIVNSSTPITPKIEEIAPIEFVHSVPDIQETPDVESFILEENKENPFLPNIANQEYEEITLDRIQESASDKENDSAKYGFEPIYFDFDKKNIRVDQQDNVTNDINIIKNLINDKKYNIVIEGHACDSAGSAQYNLILSEDRAKTIENYLLANGINKECLKTVGRGSEFRIVPFGDKEQQSPNRRVEIYAYRQ